MPIIQRLDERLTLPLATAIEPQRIAQAAVSLILRDAEGSAQTLIIKRAERADDQWSGHLALPGGRAAIEDRDLMATAARETFEEVGIDLLSGGRFIGQLEILSPMSLRSPQIEVAPFVAIAPSEFKLKLNGEVAHAFWISIADLKREGRSSFYSMRVKGAIKKWPAYPSESGPIWGLTERILSNFLSLLN